MRDMTLQAFHENLVSFMAQRNVKDTALATCEQTEVNYGIAEDCNIEWCNAHDIPVYNILRSAGCCVSTAGNLLLADIRPNRNGWLDGQFCRDMVSYLKSLGLNATTDRNDILVDGYKVAAIAGINLEPDYKTMYTGIQISINQDMEVIQNACLKPMVKVPKGLGEYGVTTEEMAQWIRDWFEKRNVWEDAEDKKHGIKGENQ